MFRSSFEADNSKFGKVLKDVMDRYGFKARDVVGSANMHKENIFKI